MERLLFILSTEERGRISLGGGEREVGGEERRRIVDGMK